MAKEQKKAHDAGDKGKFKWHFLPKLLVDQEAYQRHQAKARQMKIGEEWAWRRCGVLTVLERLDGTLAVVNGGTRLAGALQHNELGLGKIEKLPCMVFKSVCVAEEARLFVHLGTDPRPIGGAELLVAAAAGGNENAQATKDAIERHEQWAVRRVGKELPEGRRAFTAFTSFRKIVAAGDGDTVLEFVERAWPKLERLHSYVMYGVQAFNKLTVEQHGKKITDNGVCRFFREDVTFDELRAKADGYLAAGKRGLVLRDAFCTAMVAKWNEKKRRKLMMEI